MGLFDRFKKSDAEKDEKRKQKFYSKVRKFEELLLKNEDPQHSNSSIIFRSDIDKLVSLAKTKEEYSAVSVQFKKWFKYMIAEFKISLSDVSLKDIAKGTGIGKKIKLTQWNLFKNSLFQGFFALAVNGDYEDIIDFDNEFNGIKEIIWEKEIIRNTRDQKLIYNRDELFATLSIYSAFAYYKLGNRDMGAEKLKEYPRYTIKLDIDEGDYANEIFGEYGDEITAAKLKSITKKDSIGLIECPHCGEKIPNNALRCKHCKTMLK